MPPKKRCCQRYQRPQLIFYQQPLEGPKHHCESPQRPMTRPLQVPSKPIDKGTIISWVSPQFDVTVESQFPAHRKHHHRDQARQSTRKSACKFPRLMFESPQSSNSETLAISLNRESPHHLEKDNPRRPLVPVLSPPNCGELSMYTSQSLPHEFIPPDIQTPGSSVREDPISPDQRENSLPSFILAGAPDSPEPGPVLVKDTPEEEYGLKVTWRRRSQLFAYLKEKGKLSRSQFLVKI
ncbi:RAD9, HUS1, RAD1-interacting nuclear orphan protein 1 [Nannospalax galili]|uniref:RAD9-HUS1-RAD1 interacting nuclear orphan 1 n=1 Tax=Nannospalax galili TaxID=1026970 RepID=A0A8C6QBM0_NANGA|nr:RAD9, HUS1, RAD1-interacting nuclear orphan protein 1 [Nannospalax galili]XP_017651680.1 RAD9, HUS1, RAD1-interacting nuclear orphan protein 1 [Nannospalax galili]